MCSARIILSNRLSDEISSALTFVHVNILLKQNGQTIVACNVDPRHINMQRPSHASIMSEGWIEKSVTRITVLHHEACRVMTNGDSEGRIFLSCPHTNNGSFFLLTPVFLLFKNKLPGIPEYDKMQFHTMTSLKRNVPLAAEGAMCALFILLRKTRIKICSLLKNQACNINVW